MGHVAPGARLFHLNGTGDLRNLHEMVKFAIGEVMKSSMLYYQDIKHPT